MKTMNKITLLFASLFAFCGLSFAQTGFTTTTLTNALTARGTSGTTGTAGAYTITVGSTTGMYAPAQNPSYGSIGSLTAPNITYLIIDRELLRVNAVPSATTVSVERGVQGTKSVAHNAASTIYIAYANQLLNSDPTGACTAATFQYLPQFSFTTGTFWNCPTSGPNANLWTITTTVPTYTFTDGSFVVQPTACTFFPTTVTQTTTYAALGASDVFVVNSTTSSGAGSTTLTCNIEVPTRLTANKGIYITSLVVPYGLQTSAATSINGATLSTITLPTPAANETASTVTPVAITGSLTQSSTTGNLATTTAGAFWTSQITLATPWHAAANQVLVFQLAFNNTASSILTVNSPGIIVNYTESPL